VKFFVSLLLAALLTSTPMAARAAESDDPTVERWRDAMGSARWTGPMLASNAETLPKGHFYTEPYFYDVISGGEHSPGSSGFYQYGLADSVTIGVQPSFAFGTREPNRTLAVGDFKLLSQVRLTHFTPEHRIPTVAVMVNLTVPTGKYDRLGALKAGYGSGAFAPEIGINIQNYFLLDNGRPLRGRINVFHSFPLRTDVSDRSVYGTGVGFRGHATPGSKTTLIGAVEYSLTREWVLALDVEADFWGKTKVVGRDVAGGPLVRQTAPSSWSVGFAPAIEYNWNDTSGILLGVWITPKGHNTSASVIPAIAISKFW
jgi:hypothetical protein